MELSEILSYEYFNNTVQNYLISLAIIIFGFILTPIIKKISLKLAKENQILTKFIRKFLSPLFYLLAFYLGIKLLTFPQTVFDVLGVIYIVLLTWYVTRLVIIVFEYLASQYLEHKKEEEKSQRLRPLIAFVNFGIWILGLLILLDNLGFEITAVITGLGIGGIAVALAAQAILGDLFSYFVIFFDRPFDIGDFVIFEDKIGAIEKIGIKSTRIRALSGEILVVSNSTLTGAKLHNYKKMEKRRVVFKFGVVYHTEPEKLEKIPGYVKHIIENLTDTTFDRSHFYQYGNSSLDFENVYYIQGADYNKFMDIQQSVNLQIFKKFHTVGIDFAYPTRTVYVSKTNFENLRSEAA